ncbi:MAG: hypothetical protein EOP39_07715 [Rubrivivax sp.]|nr:MAG: hypothetical protein EOP39_07715 [Rubrivivax sp.]
MRILAALLLAVAIGPASAGTVITFDDYPDLYNFEPLEIVTDGFRFTAPCMECMGVEDRNPETIDGDPLPGAYNGTASLIYNTDPLAFAATAGQSFFLERLDIGLSWYVEDADVGSIATLTLDLGSGDTSTIDVALDRSYTTVVIDQRVLGVSISGGRSFGYITLDNIAVRDLPEPESAGLAALALLGAGVATRRRRTG